MKECAYAAFLDVPGSGPSCVGTSEGALVKLITTPTSLQAAGIFIGQACLHSSAEEDSSALPPAFEMPSHLQAVSFQYGGRRRGFGVKVCGAPFLRLVLF